LFLVLRLGFFSDDVMMRVDFSLFWLTSLVDPIDSKLIL